MSNKELSILEKAEAVLEKQVDLLGKDDLCEAEIGRIASTISALATVVSVIRK